MNNKSFFHNSLYVTVSSLIVGIVNFIFTIILSQHLRSVGMGLYSLILPINTLFLSIISTGILTAVTKSVAQYHTRKEYRNVRKNIRVAFFFNLYWAIIVLLFLFVLAYPISSYLIKDLRVINALRISCFTLLFMSLINIFKGYFFGTMNIFVPSFIDVFEKLLRMLLFLIMMRLFNYKTVSDILTLIFSIICFGEFISLVFYYIYYKVSIRNFVKTYETTNRSKNIIKDTLTVSVPLCINEVITTLLMTTSILIIPGRLVADGMEYKEALSLIGKFNSMSLQIILFPIIIITSVSSVIVQDITRNLSRNLNKLVKRRIYQVLGVSLLLGIIMFGICFLFADSLSFIIYKRFDLGSYIKFLAFTAPMAYLAQTARGVLNGLGKQKQILVYSTLTAILNIILLYFLVGVPSINIFGYGIAFFITNLLNFILYLYEIIIFIKKNM